MAEFTGRPAGLREVAGAGHVDDGRPAERQHGAGEPVADTEQHGGRAAGQSNANTGHDVCVAAADATAANATDAAAASAANATATNADAAAAATDAGRQTTLMKMHVRVLNVFIYFRARNTNKILEKQKKLEIIE